MTLREKLHAHIDTLPEAELRKLAKRIAMEDSEQAKDDLADTIALWEALAEPIEDEEAQAEFMDAVKRRPFFSNDNFSVQPD